MTSDELRKLADELEVERSHRMDSWFLREVASAYDKLEADARRYWFIRGAGGRSHSPHMDGRSCYEVRMMFNGLHCSLDEAIDAALEQTNAS